MKLCWFIFMSELSKCKLSSQLTFPVPIRLTSSHDKHCHCVAWALPSSLQWIRATYVIAQPLLLCVPGRWEMCCWWHNNPCISVIECRSQLWLNSLKLEVAAQWKRLWRTCESPVAFSTGVSCHTGNSVLSEKGLVLEQGWTPAISSLELTALVPEGRV